MGVSTNRVRGGNAPLLSRLWLDWASRPAVPQRWDVRRVG